MNVREPERIDCPAYLAWLRRQFDCTAYSDHCRGRIEAAHIRLGSLAGIARKPDDSRAVPLCQHHHARQHRLGERAFWADVGFVDGPPVDTAEHLFERWQVETIAGRRYRARQAERSTGGAPAAGTWRPRRL